MLKQTLEFSRTETVTLIPNSGVQFIDFAFDEAAVKGMTRAVTYLESEADRDDLTIYPVHVDAEGTRFFHPRGATPEEADEDTTYALKAEVALKRLDDLWLPFPIFRHADRGFDEGPTTWARIKVVACDAPDDRGNTHRLVLAFDTLLTPRLPGQPYTAPEEISDATDKVSFGFSANHDANIGFMGLPWVTGWLRDQYLAGLSREKGRAVGREGMRPGEHWAAYMALLDAIDVACAIPSFELVDVFTTYGRAEPVGVSLVLDIGNSRMCGVLVEAGTAQTYAAVDQIYRLELRDLNRIAHVYSEPFESRIEFATADFGPLRHASASQRVKREAFFWPSPVRVGPEAARLASMTDGTEGASGLSSPKRYLWDTAARPQAWINNNSSLARGAEPQEIRGPVIARLTEAGRLVSRTKKGLPGLIRRYSRSSLYTLMLCELLIQAVTQINAVDVRRNKPDSSSPRRLKQVILTLPTATPLAEQKVMRERISEAVQMVWEVMGFPEKDEAGLSLRPAIRLDWDEATCTHLVYLYNEIQDRFHGSPREFFSMIAQPPRNAAGAESVTMASIDMGGGTTDLMILSHEIQPGTDTVLAPRQVFREGFRLAGDDILKEVIEHYLLPEITEWLRQAGAANPSRVVPQLFGGNREGMGQRERTMRAQLVSQVFSAAAVGLLKVYETGAAEPGEALRLGDLLPPETVVAEPALRWFDEGVRRPDGGGDSLLDATIAFDAARIERLIDGLAGPMIRDLCDLVRCHDCDILLFSGRPSQFPILRRLIQASMPVVANRIVAMGDYRVGNWYPFRADDFRIRDPKTTAVVGAMLAHITSQSVSNLTLRTEDLKMRSTARFIGAMDDHGLIPASKVLLENADLESGENAGEFTLHLESNTFIGFRQLPIARWRGSPLYAVRFNDPATYPKSVDLPLKLPIRVTFERPDITAEGEEEQAMEDFRVASIVDAEGNDIDRRVIATQLQTMVIESQAEAGYWLDTGVLQMRID